VPSASVRLRQREKRTRLDRKVALKRKTHRRGEAGDAIPAPGTSPGWHAEVLVTRTSNTWRGG